jgi:hypothetical protein
VIVSARHPITVLSMPLALATAAYAGAVFLSAALLFTAQLSFTKALLPLLGGTPAVWNTAMLFFQSILLAGYAYAHGLTRALTQRRQVVLHLSLLVVSLIAVPVAGLPDRVPPVTGSPVAWLIGILLVTLGPTLFLLSATSPLIQAWFRRSGHDRAGDPYFLYAPSNVGSMLAVLGYPFLIEPLFTLREQHRGWTAGYVLFVGVIGLCGALVWRSRAPLDRLADGDEAGGTAAADVPPPDEKPGVGDRIWWLLLALVPSSLVLGVTTHLSTDVAAFPLLWVMPLSLYLLSFVLTFARRPPIPLFLSWALQLAAISVWVVLYLLRFESPTWFRFILHLAVLFSTAMVCHGLLVARRPAARYLTQFYLLLALGGALGAAFNALLAPLVFSEVVEYPLAILVACLLRPALAWRGFPRTRFIIELGLALLVGGAAAVIVFWPETAVRLWDFNAVVIAGVLALSVVVLGSRSPLRLALVVTALWIAATQAARYTGSILLRERSFFGVYEVRRTPVSNQHLLVHGTTLHGSQFRDTASRRMPTSYYTTVGPLGHLFSSQDGFADTARIGVIGLGAGTTACYAKPEQRWSFFELDPLVERIARDTTYFTFLRDCAPAAHVVLGDARVSLRAERDGTYDLLIMDAFSSDAVPVHLLTREALELYMRKLAPAGLVAFHISNRYVDLEPVLAALVGERGHAALYQIWNPQAAEMSAWLIHASRWVVIGRDSASLGWLNTDERWRPPRPQPGVQPWTDEYSSVPKVMVWRTRFAD